MSWWDTLEDVVGDVVDFGGGVFDSIAGVMGLDKDDRAEIKWWLGGLPVIGDFMDVAESHEKMEDYLENTGQSWSDVEYPATGALQPQGVSSTLNFLSSNIDSLYDDSVLIYRGENGRFTRKRK